MLTSHARIYSSRLVNVQINWMQFRFRFALFVRLRAEEWLYSIQSNDDIFARHNWHENEENVNKSIENRFGFILISFIDVVSVNGPYFLGLRKSRI